MSLLALHLVCGSHQTYVLKYHSCLVLYLATSDDFIIETLTASFAAGDTEACVHFTVIDDNIALEGDEVFIPSISLPPGMSHGEPSTATVTITDNDSMPRMLI